MMQNSSIGAMLLNPRVMDLSQKSTTRAVNNDDDTFMNLLSERIQARESFSAKNRPLEKADPIAKADQPAVEVRKPETKDAAVKADANESRTAKVSVTENTGKTEKPDESKRDSRETIVTLESMVALLEELLARLDVKTAAATPVESVESDVKLEFLADGTENVNPMELLKALLEGNAEKLKALLGEADQSKLPPEVKGFLEKIQELLSKTEAQEGNVNLELTVVKDEASTEELVNQLKAQVSEVIDKLKERISELKNAQIQNPDAVSDDTVQYISEETEAQPQTDISKDGPEKSKAETKVNGHKNENPGAEKLQESVQAKEVPEYKVASEFAVPPEQKVSDSAGLKAVKTSFPLSEKPLAQTVTNQVMMKVKLMTGENKQEMEMHLKPESLGKLSLKIIHERGEILARITAENEQVKGILESNMQMLKDALEKSGLSVQSLSVSVGNGNEKNPARQDLNENGRNVVRGLSESVKSSSAIENLNARAKIRDFYSESSQINLTA